MLPHCFNEHYYAYELTDTKHWHILDANDDRVMQCLDCYQVKDTAMVTLQYAYSE